MAFAHEGGDFGVIRCSQNPEYSKEKYNDHGTFTLTLRQIDKSRDYVLDVFLRDPQSKRHHLFSDQTRVTTHDVLAIFKGNKATVRIYLDELDESLLNFNNRNIYLICETNMGEEE